jgi:hypothetical protein
MKKLTLIIAMLMATSAWAEWTYFTSGTESVTYVNYDSLESDGNRLFAWILTDYLTPSGTESKSVVTYQETDCGIPRKYRHLVMNFYDEAMGRGETYPMPKDYQPKWSYNQPGTVGLYIVDTLCDAFVPESNS